MRTIRSSRSWALALTVALALGLAIASSVAAADAPSATANATLRDETLASFKDAASKVVALAEAIPAEKYGWRPAENVRSVGEAVMHVASGNYYLSGFLGVPAPADVPTKDFAKMTDKAKIVEALKKSNEHAVAVIQKASDAELERKRDFFGQSMSGRQVGLLIASHAHEHLGQLIAYARANGVVPPWSS